MLGNIMVFLVYLRALWDSIFDPIEEEQRSGTWATIRRARKKFGDIPIIPVGSAT